MKTTTEETRKCLYWLGEGGDRLQTMTCMKCFQAIFKAGLLFQRAQTMDLICCSAVANAELGTREKREKEICKFSFHERTAVESVNRGIRQTFLNRLFSWNSHYSCWISLALSISESFFFSFQAFNWPNETEPGITKAKPFIILQAENSSTARSAFAFFWRNRWGITAARITSQRKLELTSKGVSRAD